ncbi:MAG TPA: hypothetical protein VEK34_08315 [Methylocella sp.]|nr:hypothetical protein [Methylocella sp.]
MLLQGKCKGKQRRLLALGFTISLSPAAYAADPPSPALPFTPPSISTVPSNGDTNPYGVAFVPDTVPTDGVLKPRDILISNFNNTTMQGLGTTITRIDAHGATSTFFTAAQGVTTQGLTAALGILKNGFVIVGSLATTDGTDNTTQPGSLSVIDRKGNLVTVLVSQTYIDGPWGLALNDRGDDKRAQIFISNVRDGTIVRFDISYEYDAFKVLRTTVIGKNFNHRLDPAAIVLGPSGLFYDRFTDALFIASSTDNAIYALAHAGALTAPGTPVTVYSDPTHLRGPLDLVRLPNGNFLVANSDGSNADPNQPSELVEFTIGGTFVQQMSIDPNTGGAFGVNVLRFDRDLNDKYRPFDDDGAYLVGAVDDNAVNFQSWTVRGR